MTHLPLRIRVETTAFNSECAELGQLFSELAQRCPEVAETLCKCVVDFLDRPGGAFRLDSSATSPAGESAETLITLQFSQSFCVLVAAIRAAHREAMVLDFHDLPSPSLVGASMVDESTSGDKPGSPASMIGVALAQIESQP